MYPIRYCNAFVFSNIHSLKPSVSLSWLWPFYSQKFEEIPPKNEISAKQRTNALKSSCLDCRLVLCHPDLHNNDWTTWSCYWPWDIKYCFQWIFFKQKRYFCFVLTNQALIFLVPDFTPLQVAWKKLPIFTTWFGLTSYLNLTCPSTKIAFLKLSLQS